MATIDQRVTALEAELREVKATVNELNSAVSSLLEIWTAGDANEFASDTPEGGN